MDRDTTLITRIDELIGQTPLYRPHRWLERNDAPDAHVAVKLEGMNVTGSVKDRAALGMILQLEKDGIIKEGTTLIEPTSGNTGIALASIGASRGYKVILIMPDSLSVERRSLLAAYGAELILTPGADGMKASIAKAEALRDETPGAVIPSQFTNRANPDYHEQTTGPEIWAQTGGNVDVLVAGVGTGGTLTGAGRYLRSKNPEIELIAVEPETSAVISGEAPGKHGIQGIGAGFIPENLDVDLVSRIVRVTTEEALEHGRTFARADGILVGISSGGALAACAKLLKEEAYRGKSIVVVLPDSGDRYLSTALFKDPEA